MVNMKEGNGLRDGGREKVKLVYAIFFSTFPKVLFSYDSGFHFFGFVHGAIYTPFVF